MITKTRVPFTKRNLERLKYEGKPKFYFSQQDEALSISTYRIALIISFR